MAVCGSLIGDIEQQRNLLSGVPVIWAAVTLILFKTLLCIQNDAMFLTTIDAVLWNFPFSFTLGEAIVLSEGLSLYSVDAMVSFNSGTRVPSVVHTDVYTAIQCALLGFLAFVIVLSPLMKQLYRYNPVAKLRLSLFLCVLLFFHSYLVYSWMSSKLHCNAVHWYDVLSVLHRARLIRYITLDMGNVLLLVYWALSLMIAIGLLPLLVDPSHFSHTIARKYFHGLALILFVPGMVFDVSIIALWSYQQPKFLSLSYGVALMMLLAVEVLRCASLLPDSINTYLISFKDEKDSGSLIITHIYLLLGCALPLWLYESDFPTVSSYAGLLIIGIGDSAVQCSPTLICAGVDIRDHIWCPSVEGYP